MMTESNAIKQVQKTIFFIAREVKKICEENNINYTIIGGTLLGAVRHQGFIPWDDDMDFAMDRDNYNKFLRICKKELDSRFEILNWYTNQYYGLGYTKIILKNTVAIEKGKEKAKYPQSFFVDIFPFDKIPDSRLKKRKQHIITYICIKLLQQKEGIKYTYDSFVKKAIYKFLFFVSCFIHKELLVHICEAQMTMYNSVACKNITNICGFYGYNREKIPIEWFQQYCNVQFENTTFKAIVKKESYLEYMYGEYMQLPPLGERRSHDFLFVDYGIYNQI